MKTIQMNLMLRANLTGLTLLLAAMPTLASDAETSAQASDGAGHSGTATATARYAGDVGFARTDTRSGRVNLARGVAVGVDEDGLTLSVSLAVAPQRGPAVATNFNLSLGRNGAAAVSVGRSVAQGGATRTVTASGLLQIETILSLETVRPRGK